MDDQCGEYHRCPLVEYYEQGKLESEWIELYCKGNWNDCVRYQLLKSGALELEFVLPDGSVEDRLRK